MFAHSAARAARAALLALVLSAGSAAAQQPSAEAVAAAKELITVKGAAAIYQPLIPGVIEQAKNLFLRTNPLLGKDLNEVAAKLRADLASRSAELVDAAARLYAARFTEKELKDALAFFKSPLGRKLLAEEPMVLDQSMQNAQTWADRMSREVLDKMRAEMKKRGHEI
jgi:hypothetical protein